VRRLDIAMTALALRASGPKPPAAAPQLIPAWDEPGAAWLNRTAIAHQRAALIASLWPEPTRQCVARPVFEQLPAPAVFGRVFSVSWVARQTADARALRVKLASAFPQPSQMPEIAARAA
jgi:hypothetical protein